VSSVHVTRAASTRCSSSRFHRASRSAAGPASSRTARSGPVLRARMPRDSAHAARALAALRGGRIASRQQQRQVSRRSFHAGGLRGHRRPWMGPRFQPLLPNRQAARSRTRWGSSRFSGPAVCGNAPLSTTGNKRGAGRLSSPITPLSLPSRTSWVSPNGYGKRMPTGAQRHRCSCVTQADSIRPNGIVGGVLHCGTAYAVVVGPPSPSRRSVIDSGCVGPRDRPWRDALLEVVVEGRRSTSSES
jgi:hypothetical protein